MEFQSSVIGELAGGKGYHQRAKSYGKRAWEVRGEHVDVVYWDAGNGWASVISVIPHNGRKAQAQQFWNALMQYEDQ